MQATNGSNCPALFYLLYSYYWSKNSVYGSEKEIDSFIGLGVTSSCQILDSLCRQTTEFVFSLHIMTHSAGRYMLFWHHGQRNRL
jgi:hypothetical protein